MKFISTTALFLTLSNFTLAQEPSPTESVGCVAHGDHWHCEGPRTATATASTLATTLTSSITSSSAEATHDHDHDDDHDDEHAHSEGTGSLAASPTESVGCVAHGDHWHCSGPATATATATATNSSLSTGSGTAGGVEQTATATAGGHKVAVFGGALAVVLLAV